MSSPRKEFFLARYRERLDVPFVMGVGGAIDVYAGLRRRAPAVWQKLGLEWMFRLLQEPRRLARRYLVTNTRFVGLLLGEVLELRARELVGRSPSQ
jgi:N-acetylglucosaminyldiphosphoundecaprenol N-acetyl-beta-D-mannosaminyltransferase